MHRHFRAVRSADIIHSSIAVPDKAHWVILPLVGENCVGFLNVYAPNSASKGTMFWTDIVETLPMG